MQQVNKIQVTLNGASSHIPCNQPLSAAMIAWNYQGECFAVAINETFVPRSQYSHTEIKSGDKIEVVSPLEGG